ncbi:MAG: hypothetical protein ABIO92_00960 [Chloroflexia bacterium]
MRQRPGLGLNSRAKNWARSIRYPRAVRPEGRLRARRARDLRPYTRNPRLAFRLLRAASRLGVPGAIPGPPQLLPMSARVLAQGYLNRFAMPLLNDWLLPSWMREQSDPRSPMFTPRSVFNLMVNQTARNWTALGLPGAGHPVESTVDRWGLLTPVPGGPSLDWWVEVEGGNLGVMAASRQCDVKQRLQDDLPVVLTAYEADGLRVSSEAWMLALEDGDWAAMQVVLFNIADMPLKGTFMFALRPYNCEGISPIYNLTCEGGTLRTGTSHVGPRTWPEAEGFALSDLRSGDLFQQSGSGQLTSCHDPHGFAHGVLKYRFNIEPWEEAEFIALMPVHARSARSSSEDFGFQLSEPSGIKPEPDPHFYSRAKAATTLHWRALWDTGMKLSLPDRDLQASWEANRAHLLALHDGTSITPGPDLYHSFWFRDAAYMVYALSLTGFEEAAEQLLRGFVMRQRREGVFISHHGESDSTGQALWAMSQHLKLYPNAALQRAWKPAMERGARWIARTLAHSEDGLMPPGISSEHLGPPDRYYWDNLWSLAGLEASQEVTGRAARNAATKLRRALTTSWQADMASLQRDALPAAPGRKIDLGMVGTLAAWFPLELLPADSPMLEGTLAALEESTFYEGALFVGTGHSGWGTYLNMRIAGCHLLQDSDKGWEMMKWLLRHASPTYNWPEAIHPRSLGGSAGDGHHGWASAEWLMLVSSLLLREQGDCLIITPSLPEEWLSSEGEIKVENAPTTFGPVSFNITWGAEGRNLHLDIAGHWHTKPGRIEWKVPGRENILLSSDARSADQGL